MVEDAHRTGDPTPVERTAPEGLRSPGIGHLAATGEPGHVPKLKTLVIAVAGVPCATAATGTAEAIVNGTDSTALRVHGLDPRDGAPAG
jgi:hypothetical protein